MTAFQHLLAEAVEYLASCPRGQSCRSFILRRLGCSSAVLDSVLRTLRERGGLTIDCRQTTKDDPWYRICDTPTGEAERLFNRWRLRDWQRQQDIVG